jgi:hypothetical protein
MESFIADKSSIADKRLDDPRASGRGNDNVEISDSFRAAAVTAGNRGLPNALSFAQIAQQRLGDVFGDRPLDPGGGGGAFFGFLQDPLLSPRAEARNLADLTRFGCRDQIPEGADAQLLVQPPRTRGAETRHIKAPCWRRYFSKAKGKLL